MSDDDDIIYVKRHKSIHYGSLEEQERARLVASIANENSNDEGGPLSVVAESSQIHISNGKYMKYEIAFLSYEFICRIYGIGGSYVKR